MLSNNISIGQVIKNTSGRDAGRLFFIVKVIDDEYVFISDGKRRKLEKPKLKKVKHLKKYDIINCKVKNKIELNEPISDAFLRTELGKLNNV
ncbi:KOW domain-containing RNA-binding protein [Paraclostridium ghonii]|uniref:Ribosomal protein L14E/L6E/L27E n=1 Tax=Paraclostridium ghonii TaxID=29358 RepID=A0ABU0N5Y9_9FIRM|nr:KOW domain-containing protein [Paeniclostridium ghonii]MCM0165019.1 KOW domain-containing protein [Paeniclostridium ghonii]MDQ0558111.1 ribosomal protein L14E/L6E/L27E [Paeniclostridium ghonii]